MTFNETSFFVEMNFVPHLIGSIKEPEKINRFSTFNKEVKYNSDKNRNWNNRSITTRLLESSRTDSIPLSDIPKTIEEMKQEMWNSIPTCDATRKRIVWRRIACSTH